MVNYLSRLKIKQSPMLWWVLVLLVSTMLRPLIPYDETRYVSVGWEMWLHHHWLLPLKNGALYPDKPPLLFWLMQLGWHVVGVTIAWVKLLPLIFAVVSIQLTQSIARLLFPNQPDVAETTLALLLMSMFWCVFSNLIMFDMLLTMMVLMGWWGVIKSTHELKFSPFAALAVGLGILTKGPVVLLFIVPSILFMPSQYLREGLRRKRWMGIQFAALLAGILVALLWAIPAAIEGGEVYRHAILWSQSVGRISRAVPLDAMVHHKPWYWYLLLLPLAMMPGILLPSVWRSFSRAKTCWQSANWRYLVFSVLFIFAILSCFAGKKMNYLLPLIPFVCLAMAYLVVEYSAKNAALTASKSFKTVLVGLLVAFCLSSVAFHVLASRYVPLEEIAKKIAVLQSDGIPIAVVNQKKQHVYDNQYAFLGRLKQPVTVLHWPDLPAFRAKHPNGRVLFTTNASAASTKSHRLFHRFWEIKPVKNLNAMNMKA